MFFRPKQAALSIDLFRQQIQTLLRDLPYDENKPIIIEGAIRNFLVTADFYSPDTTAVMHDLIRMLASHSYSVPQKEELLASIEMLYATLEFIRNENIGRAYIKIEGVNEGQTLPLEVERGVSCANLLLDESYNDAVIKKELRVSLNQKIPFICSARTFYSFLEASEKKGELDTAWWLFRNKTALWVVALPRYPGPSPEELLDRLGYNAAILEPISCSSFTEEAKAKTAALEIPKEILDESLKKDYEHYQEQLAMELPSLFSRSEIRKRLNLLGHGSPGDENTEARIAGLSLQQFRKILGELQTRGMEYLNLVTCFGGGRNLLGAFDYRPRPYTVSVCSAGDFPVVAGTEDAGTVSKVVGDQYGLRVEQMKIPIFLQIGRPVDYKNFFRELAGLYQEQERGTKKNILKAQQFNKALAFIYGNTVSGLPVVSVAGRPYFENVNIDERALVLTYREKFSQELHPEKKQIPFSSIHSSFANSGVLEDRKNHCRQQANACQSLINLLDKRDPSTPKRILMTMKTHYQALLKAYASLPSLSSLPPKVVNLIRLISILEEQAKKRQIVYSCELHVSTEKNPLQVTQECVMIYPQIIQTPLLLRKHKVTNRYPLFISKIMDHNHILLMKLQTQQGTPDEVIQDSLIKNYYNKIGSRQNFFVKELEGKGEIFSRAVVINDSLRERSFYIYQIKGQPNQWYYQKREISSAEAVALIYDCLSREAISDLALQHSSWDLKPATIAMTAVNKVIQEEFIDAGQEAFFLALAQADQGSLSAGDMDRLRPEERREILVRAIKQGNRDLQRLCQAYDCKVSEEPVIEKSLMNIALSVPEPQRETLEMLSQMGASPVGNGYFNDSPLCQAIKLNNFSLVDFLCSIINDPAYLTQALCFCIDDKNPALVDLILRYRPHLEDKEEDSTFNPLIHAVWKGNDKLALKLLECGAKIFPASNNELGTSPLLAAVKRNNNKLFSAFLDTAFADSEILSLCYKLQAYLFGPSSSEMRKVWELFTPEMKESFLNKMKAYIKENREDICRENFLKDLFEVTKDEELNIFRDRLWGSQP